MQFLTVRLSAYCSSCLLEKFVGKNVEIIRIIVAHLRKSLIIQYSILDIMNLYLFHHTNFISISNSIERNSKLSH